VFRLNLATTVTRGTSTTPRRVIVRGIVPTRTFALPSFQLIRVVVLHTAVWGPVLAPLVADDIENDMLHVVLTLARVVVAALSIW
jgi:hypothetical protein